jgi:hypothetical protein
MKTIQKLLIVLIVLALIVGGIAFVGKPAMAGHAQPAATYTSASVAWLEMAAEPEAGQIVRFDPTPDEQSRVAWNS